MEQIKLPTGEKLFRSVLASGLTVMIFPKPGFLRTYAVLSANYGSIDSRFRRENGPISRVPAGIAHFLEHKLFEEDQGSVFDRFAALGASVNAFTSNTQTSYLFSTIESWPLALQELMQFVNRPFFTEENVAKEKGIIEQELRMYADHPQHRVLAALLENMYHVNPVRLDIGGTVESVWQITKEELFDCYYSFYQPANMALAVAGDVEPEAVVALVKEHYPVWEHYNGSIERIYPAEPPGVAKDWSEEQFDISRPHYLLGFKHEPIWRGEEMLHQQLIMSLAWRLITSRSSHFYNRLYDENVVTDSFGASFTCHPQFAYSVIGSETDDPERLHAELKGIIAQLQQEAICATDVERLKRQLYGGHLASYDSFEYAANRFVSQQFNAIPVDSFLKLLSSVTPAQVSEALVEQLDWARSSVSILRAGR